MRLHESTASIGAVDGFISGEIVSLSDEQWARISPLLEQSVARTGRPRACARRVLEAILWVLENKEKWHRLPATFPPQQTCYNKWLSWKKAGVLDVVLKILDRDVG